MVARVGRTPRARGVCLALAVAVILLVLFGTVGRPVAAAVAGGIRDAARSVIGHGSEEGRRMTATAAPNAAAATMTYVSVTATRMTPTPLEAPVFVGTPGAGSPASGGGRALVLDTPIPGTPIPAARGTNTPAPDVRITGTPPGAELPGGNTPSVSTRPPAMPPPTPAGDRYLPHPNPLRHQHRCRHPCPRPRRCRR